MKKIVIYQVRNVIYKTCTPELVHNVRFDSSREHPPGQTWCTNERNMLCPTCWHNMLRSFGRALREKRP